MENFACGRFLLNLKRPQIMGIVNCTPDSFSGEGIFDNPKAAIARAQSHLKNGADLLDIGAESSRPFSDPVDFAEEWRRLEPVLKEVIHWRVPISVDTYHPETMARALDLGVDLINDITGMQNPKARAVVQNSNCGICVMHMQNNPKTMQTAPKYDDVVATLYDFFTIQKTACMTGGIHQNRLIFDPGFGFGKNLQQNLALVCALKKWSSEMPLLVGFSRKSMLGEITGGRGVQNRATASAVAALWAAENGAHILRVHDVAETADALKVWRAFSTFSTVNTNNFSK